MLVSQALDAAPLSRAVEHKVHGPHRVNCCGALQRMSVAYWNFFTPALLHLQAGFDIQAVYALVVDDASILVL